MEWVWLKPELGCSAGKLDDDQFYACDDSALDMLILVMQHILNEIVDDYASFC